MMIKFEYNLQKEAYNYARVIIYPSRFKQAKKKKNKNFKLIPKRLQKKIWLQYMLHQISHSKLIDVGNHPIFQPALSYLKRNKNIISQINRRIKILTEEWKKIELQYFEILSGVLQRPIHEANYKCYLTTLFSCPVHYEKNWFMVAINRELENQIYVVCHEFMHLQFIHWYREYCFKKGLSQRQFQDLKEAVAFLLNEPEFSDIITFQDKGYEVHQRLRRELKKIWRKTKKFKKFLDESIIVTKKLMPR